MTTLDNGFIVDNTERTWRRVDLDAVLSGQWKPPEPAIGLRTDGVGIFYPGKAHSVASESEAGKTWLALGAAATELRAGNTVLYIDFEDDEGGVVGRLLALQVAPGMIDEKFCYLRPTTPLGPANLVDLQEILGLRPTLAVVDGITEAMTMHGLNPLDNKDIATFGRILPRRLAAAGCATVCLDHVTKSPDGRGRYAIGGVHKLNAIDGAAFILESRDPFGIGLTGRSAVLISKDRPGQLRKHGHRRKDGLTHFADLTVTSHDQVHAEFEILPPEERSSEFRPTTLMQKISDALDKHGAMSQRQIIATVGGKRDYVINALALLQRDGYVSNETPHRLLNTYTEEAQNMTRSPFPERSPTVPREHPKTRVSDRSPVPLPIRGTGRGTASGTSKHQIQQPSVPPLWETVPDGRHG
jgi:hypothetical protein